MTVSILFNFQSSCRTILMALRTTWPNLLLILISVLFQVFINLFLKKIKGDAANLNFSQFLILMVKKLGVDGVQKAFLSQDADGSGSVSRDELKERVL